MNNHYHYHLTPRMDDQHDAYRWFSVDELLESENVHRYIKDIFYNSGV